MNLEFFNPKTSNPSDYFWFNSFTPDVDFKGNCELLGALRLTTKIVEQAGQYSDPIVSKILKARVAYTTREDINELVSALNIFYNQNFYTDVHSLQIRFDNGEKYIYIVGKDCLDVQMHYDHQYDLVHQYSDPYALFYGYVKPVHDALEKFLRKRK